MNDRLNIHQRLLAISAQVGGLPKDKETSQGPRYNYHGIDALEAALRPALLDHQVTTAVNLELVSSDFVSTPTQRNPNARSASMVGIVSVVFACADDPSDCVEMRAVGHGLDDRDKAPGKLLSYALKSLYIAAFHLKGGEDNEAGDQPPVTGGAGGASGAPAASDPFADLVPDNRLTNEQLQPLVEYCNKNQIEASALASFSEETFGRAPRFLTPAELQDLIRRHSKA